MEPTRLLAAGSMLLLVACGAQFESAPSEAGGSGGDATGGATSEGGTGGTGGAGGLSSCATPADAFDDEQLGDEWFDWTDGGSVFEAGGRLSIGLPANTAAYAGVVSATDFALRDCWVSVRLAGPPAAESGEVLSLRVGAEVDDRLTLAVNETELQVRVTQGTEDEAVFTAPFDETDHRYLRIREQSGQVHFEVSGDGAVWDSVWSVVSPSYVDNLVAWLEGGRWRNDLPARELGFDDFNILPSP